MKYHAIDDGELAIAQIKQPQRMKTRRRAYAASSWLDPRLEPRASAIAGQGLCARAPIRAGEVVLVWGGTVVSRARLFQAITQPGRAVAIGIGRDLYLGSFPTPAAPEDPAGFLNHSCDPNLWLQDEVTLVARRDIGEDEELTIDYALWEIDEDWVSRWDCRCGSARCRVRIAGRDWRVPELQGRYQGHFSPFLNGRIRQARGARLRTRSQPAATIPAQRLQQAEAASR